MTKKCRLRLGEHSLARHFFIILLSRVFQLSCCASSLLPTTLALVLTDHTMVMICIKELVVQQHLLLLMKKKSFWILYKNKRAKLKSRGQICIFLCLCTRKCKLSSLSFSSSCTIWKWPIGSAWANETCQKWIIVNIVLPTGNKKK